MCVWGNSQCLDSFLQAEKDVSAASPGLQIMEANTIRARRKRRKRSLGSFHSCGGIRAGVPFEA